MYTGHQSENMFKKNEVIPQYLCLTAYSQVRVISGNSKIFGTTYRINVPPVFGPGRIGDIYFKDITIDTQDYNKRNF